MNPLVKLTIGAFLFTVFLCQPSHQLKNLVLVDDMVNLVATDPPLFKDRVGARQLIRDNGATLQTYRVTTDDGYILQLYRLINQTPLKNNTQGRGQPVFVGPGTLACFDIYFIEGRKKDLPFLLAEEGFDVWLGEVRGNYFSRLHETMTKDDPKFWEFSQDESGLYDLPAYIDAVLQLTGHQKLFFVGHSASPMHFIIMASLRPEYNDKVIAAYLMSTTTSKRPSEFTYSNYRLFHTHADWVMGIFMNGGVVEWWPRRQSIINWIEKNCAQPPTQDYCLDFVATACGEHRDNLDLDLFPTMFKHWPSGTSTRAIHHISQIFRRGYRRYDFGPKGNLERYNSTEAPLYPLEKITTPTLMIYGLNDEITGPEETKELARRMQNGRAVPASDKLYNHLDPVFGKNRKEVLYEPIIAEMLDVIRSTNSV